MRHLSVQNKLQIKGQKHNFLASDAQCQALKGIHIKFKSVIHSFRKNTVQGLIRYSITAKIDSVITNKKSVFI